MLYLTVVGGLFIAWLIIVVLFTPHIPYHIETFVEATSDRFVHVIESLCHTRLQCGNAVEVLTNGDRFYPAMLDEIRRARETVNMECYIFKKGRIGQQFIDELCACAHRGVRVSLVMDAVGSFGAYHAAAAPLRKAGCRVELYQRITWFRLGRLNNRTHRELLVVDGRVAFVGGAGVADWWAGRFRGRPMWRDTMVRLEGPVVPQVQGVIAENWLESCGEILTGPETFTRQQDAGPSAALAIMSSPSDRATVSRILFQTLVEGATLRIEISTPYFLPDKAFRAALVRTVTRGVEVRVIVPGASTDQHWVRLASRRRYGELLRAGVQIFEYAGGMIHNKSLIVDGLWAVVGTTNFDNRSFELNDEVNVAIRDARVSERIQEDFDKDVANSRPIGLGEWERRPLWEKLIGTVAWILERQQ